ncbi:dihydroorotase [Sorochytrium milnesiophthora]
MQQLTIPPAADLHIHLRQGDMMRAVTPPLTASGIDTYYIMPNLQPPITSTAMALAYKRDLESLAPGVNFMMTLYLTPELTVEEIRAAAAAGVAGVKSYPRGVTTNSDSGIESYETYYPIFAEMEKVGMVLNLHGEVPSDASKNITILNAEALFLSHLVDLHQKFPKLRIVLEHATTRAAVNTVKSLGDTVGCTITLHHLVFTVEDWAGKPHGFCKPVAKTYDDREALRGIIREGHARFFLGTDSAPHPRHLKESAVAPAGVFTGLNTLPCLVHVFDDLGMLDRVESFACLNGRRFYGLPVPDRRITLVKEPSVLTSSLRVTDEVEVVPFWAGKTINWTLRT